MGTITRTDAPVNKQGVEEVWVWCQDRWEWKRIDRFPARPGFLVVEGQPGGGRLPGHDSEAQQ
jgi:hypothetical protein